MPLVVVGEFKTLEEAIAKANDTEYGLTAGIFSEDPKEVQQFMDQMQFGVLYANRSGEQPQERGQVLSLLQAGKGSGATGRGVCGSHYLLNFLRDQSHTIVSKKEREGV